MFASVRSFRLQDADADDAVQMTWLRLVENCHRIQSPEHLVGWLTTTARQECLHILRRQAQHPPPTPRNAAEAEAREGDSSVDPEQLVVDADIASTLGKLIEELPPRGRTLLCGLFSSDPRPYAEVARAAGIVKGLPGTITVLRDAGYSYEEILRWLFTAEDSLSGTPIGALRSDRGGEVKRQAKAM